MRISEAVTEEIKLLSDICAKICLVTLVGDSMELISLVLIVVRLLIGELASISIILFCWVLIIVFSYVDKLKFKYELSSTSSTSTNSKLTVKVMLSLN